MPEFDSRHFRRVLGHYPTGVTVVTARDPAGQPVGLAVGSFSSVSLDPPLVAFMPDKSSSTFPKIREAGSFCVNVLGAEQESVCRSMSTKGGDKFRGVDWRPASSGSPIIDGVVVWIDCDIETIVESGDHFIVVGRVRGLDIERGHAPLLFFQGGYGQFTQMSRAAPTEPDLVVHLQRVDVARPHMQQLADQLAVECLAVSLVQHEMVIVGSAGSPRNRRVPTRLGQRFPHVPPAGGAFVAWASAGEIESWLERAGVLDRGRRELHMEALARIRARGWSLGIDSPEYRDIEAALFRLSAADGASASRSVVHQLSQLTDVYEPADLEVAAARGPNNISAPVFDAVGGVPLLLSLYGLPSGMQVDDIESYAARLLETALVVSALLSPGS